MFPVVRARFSVAWGVYFKAASVISQKAKLHLLESKSYINLAPIYWMLKPRRECSFRLSLTLTVDRWVQSRWHVSLEWHSEVAPRCVTGWGTGCFIQAMSNDRNRKSCGGAGVLRMEWWEAECAVNWGPRRPAGVEAVLALGSRCLMLKQGSEAPEGASQLVCLGHEGAAHSRAALTVWAWGQRPPQLWK